MSLTRPFVICLTCTLNDSFVAAQQGQPGVIDSYTDTAEAETHARENPEHVMVGGEDFQRSLRGFS